MVTMDSGSIAARAEYSGFLKDGARAAWPICLGYIPIGLAFGVLAQKAGLSPFQIGLMSLLVFAGSSQFIAVSMLDAGAAIIPIVLTTFMVNLRHVLMSSSLSVFLRRSGWKFLSLYAYGVTDESFAVNTSLFRAGGWHPYKALVLNHAANAVWIGSTVTGGVAGQLIPEGSFGIDYALSAMFICLLIFQLRGRIYAVTGLIAGGAAVCLSVLIPGNAYVVLASLFAATAGFVLQRRARK